MIRTKNIFFTNKGDPVPVTVNDKLDGPRVVVVEPGTGPATAVTLSDKLDAQPIHVADIETYARVDYALVDHSNAV